MVKITIDLEKNLYNLLKEKAKMNERSMRKEVLTILKNSLIQREEVVKREISQNVEWNILNNI